MRGLENYEEMMSVLEAIHKLKCDTPCRLAATNAARRVRLQNVPIQKESRAAGNAQIESLKHAINLSFSDRFMEMPHKIT